MSDLTEANTYKPTPAEKKLLEVLVNPEYLGKSVQDVCKMAGIVKQIGQENLTKPDLKSYINEHWIKKKVA